MSVIFIFSCFLFNGCTIVKIDGATPSIKYRFGIANVLIENDHQNPVVVMTSSIGVVKTPNALSLGYISEFVSKFPDPSQCNLLILVETLSELNSIKQQLKNSASEINSLCIASKDGHSWLFQKNT